MLIPLILSLPNIVFSIMKIEKSQTGNELSVVKSTEKSPLNAF